MAIIQKLTLTSHNIEFFWYSVILSGNMAIGLQLLDFYCSGEIGSLKDRSYLIVNGFQVFLSNSRNYFKIVFHVVDSGQLFCPYVSV